LEVVDSYTGLVAWSSVTSVYVWPPGQTGLIAGPTCIVTGTQYEYALSSNYTDSTIVSWSAAGGTISGSSSGTGLTQINVTWNRNGTDTLTVITSNPADTSSLIVNPSPALSGGTITSGANQTINYNTTPANIVGSGATGGNCFPSYDYQWMYSTNGTSWNNITGATSLTLNLSTSALTQTTYYRYSVDDVEINTGAYSATATVTVYPQLVPGSVSPSSQNDNYNTSGWLNCLYPVTYPVATGHIPINGKVLHRSNALPVRPRSSVLLSTVRLYTAWQFDGHVLYYRVVGNQQWGDRLNSASAIWSLSIRQLTCRK
jgi:hypothetical protein